MDTLGVTMHHTATHCNTLQHTATHCKTLQHTTAQQRSLDICRNGATHCNTLQLPQRHCNTRQRTATHQKALQHILLHRNPLQHTEPHRRSMDTLVVTVPCNTVQSSLSHYNTLQHTATHCITSQPNATHCNTPKEHGHISSHGTLQHGAIVAEPAQNVARSIFIKKSDFCVCCRVLQRVAVSCSGVQYVA